MRKAVLYTRQSKAKTGTISHEVQENACKAYAAANGIEIVETINEKGRSGRTVAKRPSFQRAVQMMQDGKADVMLVWRWSRFARNTLDGLIVLQSIEDAGGEVISAEEPIDRSSMGKFSQQILLGMAELESNQKADLWKDSLDYRIAKGLPPLGKEYWGYIRTKADPLNGVVERYEIDPVAGPKIKEGLEKLVAGTSHRAVARWLNEQGLTSSEGTPHQGQTLRRFYMNPFLRGKITWNGQELPGAHKPLISEGLYRKYLDQVSENRLAPRRDTPNNKLVGLVVCGECGAKMSYAGPTPNRPDKKPVFRCRTKAARGKDYCSMSQIMLWKIDDALAWWMPRHQDQAVKSAPPESDVLSQIEDKKVEREQLETKLTETLLVGTQAGLSVDQMADALKALREQIEAVRNDSEGLARKLEVSKKRFWEIEDVIHGEDVVAARDMLRKIVDQVIRHEDRLEIIPRDGEPYTWWLASGPVENSGWESLSKIT